MPDAYKTGFQDFYGRDFKVAPGVLIPRPETEQLIDEVLKLAGLPFLPGVKPSERKLSEKPLILDVGTGSGILAVTLKLEIPEAKVVGLDISEEALKVARWNAEKFGAEVEFLKSDLLRNYQGLEPEVVVANLPYVDKTWGWLDKEALQFEPTLALYAEDGGLALIKRLLLEIKERNWHPYIILELDPSQQGRLAEFAEGLGFKVIKSAGFVAVLSKVV